MGASNWKSLHEKAMTIFSKFILSIVCQGYLVGIIERNFVDSGEKHYRAIVQEPTLSLHPRQIECNSVEEAIATAKRIIDADAIDTIKACFLAPGECEELGCSIEDACELSGFDAALIPIASINEMSA